MRYTFLLYSGEAKNGNLTAEQIDESKAAFGAYIGAMQEAGVFLDTDWLQTSDNGTTITLAGGERRVQDGPYADTKEQLGGYFAVDVANLDEALSWAEKCPVAQYGIIEVRPSAMGS